MTHREMAEHLRFYRESATAALGDLRMAGIVAVVRKQIPIERARLERASREELVSFTGIKSGGLRYTRQITHTIGAGIQNLSRPRRPPMARAGIDVIMRHDADSQQSAARSILVCVRPSELRGEASSSGFEGKVASRPLL
jgi:hypothetical protein